MGDQVEKPAFAAVMAAAAARAVGTLTTVAKVTPQLCRFVAD